MSTVAFSPDGRWLASGEATGWDTQGMPSTIRFWDVASGACLGVFPTGANYIHELALRTRTSAGHCR